MNHTLQQSGRASTGAILMVWIGMHALVPCSVIVAQINSICETVRSGISAKVTQGPLTMGLEIMFTKYDGGM